MSSEATYILDSLARGPELVEEMTIDAEIRAPIFTDELPDSTVQPTRASDEHLLNPVRNGDKDGLRNLLQRYARSVRTAANRVLHDDAKADDLVQDAFLFRRLPLDRELSNEF